MTRRTRSHGTTTGRLAALGTALLVGWLAVAPPVQADPGPSGPAQRAEQLRRQVDALQTRTALAVQRYDAAEQQLGDAVTRHLLAQRQLDEARAHVTDQRDGLDRRVRALYMSGGSVTLLATVLDATDLGDAMARLRNVRSLVGSDHRSLVAAQAAASAAEDAESRLATLAADRTKAQAAAAAAADEVRNALAEQQALLAAADARVRELAAQAAVAERQHAAAAFAAQLAAARATWSAAPTDAPNATAAAAVAAARTRLGSPYVWGATGPDSFDCSGLTQWAYAQAGVTLPRVAADQWSAGRRVSLAELAPGDLLFWATDPADPATIHHVALYIGSGLMIAAPHTGDVVRVQAVYATEFIGAVRPTERRNAPVFPE